MLDAFVHLDLEHSSLSMSDRIKERALESQEKRDSAFGAIVDVTEDGERPPDFAEI